MPNFTMVTEFLLTRFSDVWEYRVLHATLFLLMYLATLMGNFLIVTVTSLEKKLQTPMYFFLRKLFVLDMFYISVTVPKACVIFLLDSKAISMVACTAQIFFVFLFACTELLILTILAHDCSVAICQTLNYPVVMSPQVCVQMMLSSIVTSTIYAGFHMGNISRLPFCPSKVIHEFFCGFPSLLKLSCSDTLITTVVVAGGCFAFITISYIYIFSTVLKFLTRREQGNDFSTCVPHILVVTVFISSGTDEYVKPISSSSTIQDMITSVFYSTVTPFLNPIIYSLINKHIKEAVKKIISKNSPSEN